MSLYGQTLDWHGRGHLSGAKLVNGLLSVGTQEQPDPGHLVDDFQRTGWDKLCVCVCVMVCKNTSCLCVGYIHKCVFFVPYQHVNSTFVCVSCEKEARLSHICVVKEIGQGTND